MSRVSIDCPHCGQTTRLDLAFNLSTQKCDRCGVAFRAVNTGLAGSREIQPEEPPDWRRADSGEWDEEPQESAARPPAPAPPSRRAWIAVACTLAAVAATALIISRRPPATPAVKPFDSTATSLTSPDGSPSGTGLGLRDRLEAAAAAAAHYLASTTIEEVLPLVDDRETLEPTIRAFYDEGEGQSQLPFPPFTLAPVDRQVWVDALQAAIISYDTPGQVPRAVALRQSADGRWLVDWPSAAAFNEVPLSQFRALRESTPRLFRLLAVRDDYYNREFTDDREWLCLRLSDVTLNHRIYAYARRQSPLGQQLLEAPIPRRGTSSPIILRLRFPENAPADDQVEITEFLGLGWIEGNHLNDDPASMPATAEPASPAPSPR